VLAKKIYTEVNLFVHSFYKRIVFIMNIIEVQTIYENFINSQHKQLVSSLLKLAIRYARLRVDWLMADIENRNAMEQERTAAHNAFISSCDIVSRNMLKTGEDAFWRKQIGADRKDIGDFACLLHAVMGLRAR